MTVDIEELIAQPFREVVERGREAAQSAKDAEEDDEALSKQMQKSAKALIKEGERALQRLQPVWESQFDRHGYAFTEAVGDNEDILEKQRVLEDLLYDLDDYVTIEGFDADRFAEVQSASKSFALTLLETVKRLRIVDTHIRSVSTPTTIASTSTSSEIHWPQPSQVCVNPHHQSQPTNQLAESVISNDSRPRRPSTPDVLGVERDSIRLTSNRKPAHSNSAHAPSSPRISEWVNEQTTIPEGWHPGQSPPLRKAKAFPPPITTANPQYPGMAITTNLDQLTLRNLQGTAPRPYSPASPGQDDHMAKFAPPTATWFPKDLHSPVTAGSRTSVHTSTASSYSGRRSSVMAPPSEYRAPSVAPNLPASAVHYESRSLPPIPPLSPTSRGSDKYPENGLMLANESSLDVTEEKSRPLKISSNCQIEPHFSLYQMKGFCEGAQMFKRSGQHSTCIKAIKAKGTDGGMAKCTECEFRRPHAEVDLDASLDQLATRSKANVLYRARFLYKSHVTMKSQHDIYYGCLFCIQLGSTTHEGDSTIFRSEDDLFQHLARHPQPLPEVAGVTVLYGDVGADDPQRNDFDLRFIEGPVPNTYPEDIEQGKLPTAMAIKSHERRHGDKPLTDPEGGKDNILEFVAGSRIIGVELPHDWKGKWCYGWQNGIKGSFPLKNVTIEPPRRLPAMEFTEMAVTTRWPLSFKDKGQGWLSFGLYETVTNVSWLSEDDWCWAGVNKKGKTGIFPKSYINEVSLRRMEPAPAPRPRASTRNSSVGGASITDAAVAHVMRF